ncbi:DUF2309 domain-containing protein [Dechloromonas denitrificans]|uniref:DUF2309 domain-containing protein n=1 Tax=Dechloromonas denitrificans TaxID=281362 RepID=UPI001CFAFB16|nr:DUF2309 domain-containing protein [Dechloromonas denitrificans]UCV07335.1 DUF2309 domain-containing protein [Dechloromonas denitrificans]
MSAADQLPIRQRLAHWVEHLSHVLPAQAPIREFVHHNTLHGFQHLPFPEALAAAQRLTGATTYWPEARFRECHAAGRIDDDDLLAALVEAGVAELEQPVMRALSRRDVLLASLLAAPETPGAARLDWLRREQGLAGDPVFAQCRALTAALPGAADTHSADWEPAALTAWESLCQRVGVDWTLRSLLEYLSGEDVLEQVRSILQRQLAAHLDLGVAAWRNPRQEQGFFAAWRACAGLDMFWELEELPNVRDEIVHLGDDPLDVLIEELARLIPEEHLWYGYLERLSLELPGWSGMFLWRDRHPGRGDGTPVAMLDYLAVRVLLERMLCEDLMCRLTGVPMSFEELRAYYAASPAEFFVRDALRRRALPEQLQNEAAHRVRAGNSGREESWRTLAEAIAACPDDAAATANAWRLAALCRQLAMTPADLATLSCEEAAAVLDCAASLDGLQRGQIWLLAYERHYREQLFAALATNHHRQKAVPTPSAQVVLCMDDREEGTRRHLEEIAPAVATYGAAGFFGVVMYWQGADDEAPSALCPVVVQPIHLVREQPLAGRESAFAGYTARRDSRLRWRERLYQGTRRRPLGAPLLTALAGLPALLTLTAASLAPGWFGKTAGRWRQLHDGRPATGLGLTAAEAGPATPEQPQHGFTDDEQIDRVEAFLQMIGLTGNFAPLVLMFGHGSSSLNNPHRSAYDCGACSGRHGGPNARVFATMANRPPVRQALLERGIAIPDSTWFVAAEHNTCDDGIEWYDLEAVPERFQAALDVLLGQVSEACRAHAAERCRRLASAPPRLSPWQASRHVVGRANDISQARPELGHANNAAALIGRREMSRGLFLDRRTFLISYDPTADRDGYIVEGILLATAPVGAGIALEYYFSSVDNERFGCGSKITHNITGLFGVMEGADSDLRTGLPWQMVEIHEPMRLLVVVEQTPERLTAILQRQPQLQELINNAWIILAAKEPLSGAIHHYCPRRGWLPWSGKAVLPQVARSVDWFAGASEALAPALLLGAAR